MRRNAIRVRCQQFITMSGRLPHPRSSQPTKASANGLKQTFQRLVPQVFVPTSVLPSARLPT